MADIHPSVQVPRLTTSNLKDEATVRTAKMLSALNVEPLADSTSVASKWSYPPQLQSKHQPPKNVTVNYTETFPKPTPSNQHRRHQQQPNPTTGDESEKIDSHSAHSNASGTSAGSYFTKAEGESFFTSLTESFMESQRSRDEKNIQEQRQMREEMQSNQKVFHEAQKDFQAAMLAQSAESAAFRQMFLSFAQMSTSKKSKKSRKSNRSPRRQRPLQSTEIPPSTSKTNEDRDMDIDHEHTNYTEYAQPMDVETATNPS
jgi:hypothetical protein